MVLGSQNLHWSAKKSFFAFISLKTYSEIKLKSNLCILNCLIVLGKTLEKVGDGKQATTTRKSLEDLFNNSSGHQVLGSGQQMQRSSHRVGSFSSISSADSGLFSGF